MGEPKGHRNHGDPESNNIFTSRAIPSGPVQLQRLKAEKSRKIIALRDDGDRSGMAA
jgi:hypothetical protein